MFQRRLFTGSRSVGGAISCLAGGVPSTRGEANRKKQQIKERNKVETARPSRTEAGSSERKRQLSLFWTVASGTFARLARQTAGQEPHGRRETRCSLQIIFKDNIEMGTVDGDNTRSTQSCQTTRLLKKRARADGGPSAAGSHRPARTRYTKTQWCDETSFTVSVRPIVTVVPGPTPLQTPRVS